jgi:RluA family pseudouridine synthase
MNAKAITQCPVLHQDRWLVLVNKPAGALSHPNENSDAGHAAFEGRYDFEQRCFQSPAGKVWLAHRLDQDTSGVLLAALSAEAAERCRDAFAAGTVRKTYLALVAGLPKREGIWLDHLSTEHRRGGVRTQTVPGRPPNAELRYRVLASNRERQVSLIEIDLITGKTHQIRAQAAARHHPVLGDDVYGNFALNREMRKQLGLGRLFLHAAKLELKHPASGKLLRVEAPLAEELRAAARAAGVME